MHPNPEHFAQVAPTYEHGSKHAAYAQTLQLAQVTLKWTLVFPESAPFNADEIANAQRYIADEVTAGRLPLRDEAGFVVQHRCTGGDTTGTYCVWVIPVVMHEQRAWLAYLRSQRDNHAAAAYLRDQFSGVVG